MLSYQHGFHAGNLADVHKHALLAWMLDYLSQKPKSLTYVDTHAGRGLYDLDGAEAVKTGEAAAGIGRVSAWFDPSHPLHQVLTSVRVDHGASAYPGSPLIAAKLLRPEDTLLCAELHPSEYRGLTEVLGKRATCRKTDGMTWALSIAPPMPRRGILVCDPSYEVKSDYKAIPDFFGTLHRVWNVGILMLWYPILRDERHTAMVQAVQKVSPDALRSEVRFPPAREGHGMVGSGVLVVNPPWGLSEEAKRLAGLFAAL